MKRQRNSKGQFTKASKVSEFGFVNLSTYTSPVIKEVNGKDYIEYKRMFLNIRISDYPSEQKNDDSCDSDDYTEDDDYSDQLR